MSLTSHEWRKLALTGVVAAAALGTSASSSQAAMNANLSYNCKYPLIGVEPLDIAIDIDTPDFWGVEVATPPFSIKAVATAGGDTVEGLQSIDGLAAIEGVAVARVAAVAPTGPEIPAKVSIGIPKYVLPTPIPDPLVLNAAGETPSLTFQEFGPTAIKLKSLQIVLKALDANGDPILLPELTKGIENEAVTPSDTDPTTFDVYCKLKDAASNPTPTLGIIEVGIIETWEAPTTPGEPEEGAYSADDFTPTAVNVRWRPSTDPDGDLKGYFIRYEGGEEFVSAGATSKWITGLPECGGVFEISAVDERGEESAPLVQDLTVLAEDNGCGEGGGDITAPGSPELVASTETSVTLKWTASEGDVDHYDVYRDNAKITSVTGPQATISGLKPATSYALRVVAVSTSGVEVPGPPTQLVTKPDTTRPSTPIVNVVPAGTSAQVTWTPSADNVGVASYDVFLGDAKVASVTGTSHTLTGLVGGTDYTVKVVARDAAGNVSDPGVKSVRIIIDEPPRLSYTLTGTTNVKTLTKGALALSGKLSNVDLQPALGKLSGDLTLNQTTGRLTALGFLPITANIGFSSSGKTTGTLVDGVLKTNSKVRIKINNLKIFSVIPLVGGNSCQTKQLSDINLKSQPGFNPVEGGTLAGVYSISDLNGCGGFTGLVSSLTAGSGNTISLDLAPTR